MITATSDTGDADLLVSLFICETDPMTSECLDTPQYAAVGVKMYIGSGAVSTFSVFVFIDGSIGFELTHNRICIRSTDESGCVAHGATSVAVWAQ